MNLMLPSEVHTQLVFLLAEVRTQVQTLKTLFKNPSNTLARSLLARSGHTYNLRQRVHARCIKAFQHQDRLHAQSLKAAGDIADELERIAALCRDAARDLPQIQQRRILEEHKYLKRFNQIDAALALLERILEHADTREALQLSQTQQKLARFYRRSRRAHLKALKHSDQTESLITSLFLARHLLEMGNALVNISEALIGVMLGQTMNLEQFLSLKAMVGNLGLDKELDALSLSQIAETRSGSAISALSHEPGSDAFIGVLKEGELRKVQEERRGLERWNAIFPGIAPQILSQHNQGQSGALIIEHLPGYTLEQLLVSGPNTTREAAITRLIEILPQLWLKTRKNQKVNAEYLQQLKRRLPGILNVHPEFDYGHTRIGDLERLAFRALLSRVELIETKLNAPFSVYIHGDFNLDNILFDDEQQKIKFIDLHRSRASDYVQDVSVFMVSCLRLPLFDSESRQRLEQTALQLFLCAQQFADSQEDGLFAARMTLALARSLITSTRFILDESHARGLFERGVYLLEHLVHSDPFSDHYELPIKELLHA
ncbi:phosphotransferase [Nitrincola tapanii]|uniref:Aminoglycoside phosphotransferase domain-containing protein n=1 Tax=Nitrincola tapanii TaxID=1708751 RepID=A0A5A9VZQ1_9GAMM|nr:phosphotransferase [Nitrincola tapanii]KAA0873714.1 hypothetical protein E1H14_11725 [Nitrincola tapanii]